MTYQQIINRTDALRPNALTFQQKLGWLADLDGRAFDEVILTHEHEEGAEYSRPADGTEDVLIASPYDEVYHHYLCMQMDLAGREIAAYNNDRALFNSAWLTWQDAYNRGHMPISQAERWNV